MQRKKVYHVSLYLDLHAVTCPGVWLCPKGKVAVRVAIFGVSETTKKLVPSFPLFFHERFHFQKKYKKVSNLHQVERILHRSPVTLELLQYPQGSAEVVKLADFKAHIGDIIYPPGGDMDLLFCTTDTFPGIIGPKGEVTTRLMLTEGGIKDNNPMPTTVLSKGTKGKQNEEPLIRQKPVCHTKHYLYCGCFDKNAASKLLAKAMKKRKELLAKKRTSQEAIKQTPAHIMSHKNHGDFLPGYEEQSEGWDGGEMKYGKCNCCCQEQTIFRATSEQTPSEESLIKGKNMKDGYTTPTQPQPRWNPSPTADYKHEKVVAEEEEQDHRSEDPQLLPHKDVGPCCLCCPRAPGYVLKRKSSTEMNQRRDIQSTPMGKSKYHTMEERNHQDYPMDRNMYQSSPKDRTLRQSSPTNQMMYQSNMNGRMLGQSSPNERTLRQTSPTNQMTYQSSPTERMLRQSSPTEGNMYKSSLYESEGNKYPLDPIERKKNLDSSSCPLCDNNSKLMEIIRKKTGDRLKEDSGHPLFYSNLCKAYQKLMNEYCQAPPGLNSGYLNHSGSY